MRIVQATKNEVVTVAAVLREAASWLVEQGHEMWQLHEVTESNIANDVEAGAFYLAYEGTEVVGTVKFQLEDPFFWPEIEQGTSAYVHRLAVTRKWAGKGASQALLNFALNLANSLGRSCLRLDCAADRTALRTIYENFGFTFHSYKQAGNFYVARYVLATKNSG